MISMMLILLLIVASESASPLEFDRKLMEKEFSPLHNAHSYHIV
jgi:hypothetical protein